LKAGKIKRSDLLKEIAKYGYDNAQINTNGKMQQLRDVYGAQYDTYKQQGADIKKAEDDTKHAGQK